MQELTIGIMTQKSKRDYLEVLFHSLLNQEFQTNSKIEIIIFADECELSNTNLESKYTLKQFRYKKPFNIGHVQNLIIQEAKGEYVVYLDDDVAIGPRYIHKLLSIIQDSRPAVIAGLSYQVFRRPNDFFSIFKTSAWEQLICDLGRRDYYTRRIGRYDSELLIHEKIGESNWLGAIGRSMAVNRNLALQYPFYESNTMGFQDLEFAYRMQKLGRKVLLQNHPDLACLHLFHSSSDSKQNDYLQTFNALVSEERLPLASKYIFFANSDIEQKLPQQMKYQFLNLNKE